MRGSAVPSPAIAISPERLGTPIALSSDEAPITRSTTMNAQTPAASNDNHDDAVSRMLDEGSPHGD